MTDWVNTTYRQGTKWAPFPKPSGVWMQGEDRLYMRRYSKHSWTVVAFNERPAKPRHKKLAGPFPDLDSAKVAFLLIRSAL